eukprot:COSAG04_NODE_1102_length_8251_cov_3.245339_5_plen_75_part_00
MVQLVIRLEFLARGFQSDVNNIFCCSDNSMGSKRGRRHLRFQLELDPSDGGVEFAAERHQLSLNTTEHILAQTV